MIEIPEYKLEEGLPISFRVPGLAPVPGKSYGVVQGLVVFHDTETHLVTVSCPRGDEYTLPENMILSPTGKDLRVK